MFHYGEDHEMNYNNLKRNAISMYILFDVSFLRIISGTHIFSNSQKFLYGERIHQQDPFLGEKPPKKSNKFRKTEGFEIFQIFFFTFYGCKDKYLLLESREIYIKPPANQEKYAPCIQNIHIINKQESTQDNIIFLQERFLNSSLVDIYMLVVYGLPPEIFKSYLYYFPCDCGI